MFQLRNLFRFVREEYENLPFKKIATDPSSRAIAVVTDSYLRELDVKFKGEIELRTLEETFNSAPMVLMIPKTSVLIKPLVKIIRTLSEAGIVQSLIDANKKVVKKPIKGPQVLTMETLSASFKVWLYSVIVSILVLIFELGYYHRKKILKLLQSPLVYIIFKPVIKAILKAQTYWN